MHLLVGHSRRVLGIGISLALVTFVTGAANRSRAPVGVAVTEASSSDGVRLVASLGQRRLVVEDAGQVVLEYGVAIGLPSHPTPRGQFAIRRMIWNPGWVPPKNRAWARGKTARKPGDPNSPMQAVKIFFKEPHYYIHGTNVPSSIGSAASRGCLRMDPNDAAELGAYLMERGGQPREEGWFRRVLRFGQSTVIHLDNPIPLTITN